MNEIGHAHFDRLRAGARIEDFLPILVYRYTREDLLGEARAAAASSHRPALVSNGLQADAEVNAAFREQGRSAVNEFGRQVQVARPTIASERRLRHDEHARY